MKNDQFINLGKVEGVPHIELFDTVSKLIAEDNLEEINQRDKQVVYNETFYTKYVKRSIDLTIASIALIGTAPINAVLAACTYFDVGRPIVFKQVRIGKNSIPFTIVKFRNMTNETDEEGNLLPSDKRVTSFGKFVRKTSLDELLNFWSVFKGDMSLVGPRPLPYDYYDYISERHKARFKVKPGLECPFIVPKEEKVSWSDQFENDVFYVENISFMLDLKMAFALVRMVLDSKSSNMRGNAVRGSFMGYHKDGSSINSQKVESAYYHKALKRMKFE